MRKNKLMRRMVLFIVISAFSIILLAVFAGNGIKNGTIPQTESVHKVSEKTESDSITKANNADYIKTSISDHLYAEEVFVQHDKNNQDRYLLSLQGDLTIIYHIINVKLTAGKQWTETGRYVNALKKTTSATAPDDYIAVKENETYFVRLYGLYDDYPGENGDKKSPWGEHTPMVKQELS